MGKNLWASAQVTQFTQPGWHFLNSSASAYLGGNRANGSYVSLKSPNNTDYSTIYETSAAVAPLGVSQSSDATKWISTLAWCLNPPARSASATER